MLEEASSRIAAQLFLGAGNAGMEEALVTSHAEKRESIEQYGSNLPGQVFRHPETSSYHYRPDLCRAYSIFAMAAMD